SPTRRSSDLKKFAPPTRFSTPLSSKRQRIPARPATAIANSDQAPIRSSHIPTERDKMYSIKSGTSTTVSLQLNPKLLEKKLTENSSEPEINENIDLKTNNNNIEY